MDTRKFAVQQAVKLVSTMSIENKTKAVFDLAEKIIQWIGDPPTCEPTRDNKKWWQQGTVTTGSIEG